MLNVREPAVAGSFYSASPAMLEDNISLLLREAQSFGPRPFALVLPHAGYIYSGAVAAKGYSLLKNYVDDIKQVVLLGPSHRVPLRGMAIPCANYFSTPLGQIAINQQLVDKIKHLSQVSISDLPHAAEHSLEVHLPFLQMVLKDFSLLPILVGSCQADQVAEVIQTLAQEAKTLFIVSTDLSHFHTYDEAQKIDRQTTQAIESLYYQLDNQQACGCKPLNGLLLYGKRNGLSIETLSVKNSGDTAGGHERVVGYGAYSMY